MIVRKEKTCNFTVIPNELLYDQKLSMMAKGVLCYLLSKPDHWKVQPSDIQANCGIGRQKVYSLIRELIEAGYVSRKLVRTKDGEFKTEYVVSDSPVPESGTCAGNQHRTSAEIWHSSKDSVATITTLEAKEASKEQSSGKKNISQEPLNPKQVLFRELFPKAVSYSGISAEKLRPLFGKWLKMCSDDSTLLAEVIRAALDYQPGEFVSFVHKSLEHRTKKKTKHQAWMDVWK